MARFDKRQILEVMGKNHSAWYVFGLEAEICEAIYGKFIPERLERIHLALRPIFSLVGEQLAISKKGIAKSPDYRRAIIEAKREQLELLEQIYDLGVSFECEHMIITLNEKMKSELEQFESMERGGVSDNEILVGRIKGAWAELMPDVKWSFYRSAYDDTGVAGCSAPFVAMILTKIPNDIRPSITTLAEVR